MWSKSRTEAFLEASCNQRVISSIRRDLLKEIRKSNATERDYFASVVISRF
jgi:hypothetical protein